MMNRIHRSICQEWFMTKQTFHDAVHELQRAREDIKSCHERIANVNCLYQEATQAMKSAQTREEIEACQEEIEDWEDEREEELEHLAFLIERQRLCTCHYKTLLYTRSLLLRQKRSWMHSSPRILIPRTNKRYPNISVHQLSSSFSHLLRP